MKVFIFILFILSLFSFSAIAVTAQNKTIILVRHAEKDVSPTASRTNPPLTDAGRARAARLFELVKPYQPKYIFSTMLERTIATAVPSAEGLMPNYRMQIQFYNYDELAEFAAKLKNLKTNAALVVGHNTTTPELANLLIGEKKYQAFGENEYNKMIIITIKGAKIEHRMMEF